MHIEASSGIVLLAAAAVALMWANSPWAESYEHLWETPVGVGIGDWRIDRSLHFWINDLLMAVFFLVVGLEIKRELTEGALADIRRAALPIAAAVGGMLLPAAVYFALNPSGPARGGWGVPMATDIAFAVGILTLLGKRVPATLRILLLALAIIDDIGAILVIAVFYSGALQYSGLVLIGMGLLATVLLLGIGVRPGFSYVIPALVVWAGMYRFGVHPTIAGVVVGLMAPVKPWFGREGFLNAADRALEDFRARLADPNVDDHALIEPLDRLGEARREALSPAKRLETALHPWVAFGIMPLFALANAGVDLGGIDFADAAAFPAFLGVTLGLAIGKPFGIVGLSWIAVRTGVGTLPPGVTWKGFWIIGCAGGIGFTMAIFIAELAFAGSPLLAVGKLGVLVATAAAAVATLVLGRALKPGEQSKATAATTATQVERSAEYWTGEARG